jgi:hypothetical protein
MKESWFLTKPMSFFKIVAAVMYMFSAACNKEMGDHNNTNNQTYELSGIASGSLAEPANGSGGTGTISGTYNANTNLMSYTVMYSNLQSAAVSGSFFSKEAGESSVHTGIAWNFSSSVTAASGSYYSMITLTAEQETKLLANQFHYVIHTGSYTHGEIRGQIVPKLRK